MFIISFSLFIYFLLCVPVSADAVATTWMNIIILSLTWVVPFGISASLFSNFLINVFQSLRVTYIEGQDGQLPLLFNIVNIYAYSFIFAYYHGIHCGCLYKPN